MTSKSVKFETLNCFCLYFSHCHVKGFSSKLKALKVDVMGAENILFAGASLHLSARKYYRLGKRRGWNETSESAVSNRLGGEQRRSAYRGFFFSTNVLLVQTQQSVHTPSIAFRHLPPNSARFSYAAEGALFISAQLSSDAVSALRKVRVLI